MNRPQKFLGAALFDLDGTLLDTAPDVAAAFNALRAEQGLPALPYEPIRLQVSHGAAAVLRLGFATAEPAEFERLRERLLELYLADLSGRTRLFDGFETVLGALERHGIPWGVVTNKPQRLTEPLLQQLGLRRRAACVLSGDTLPERKPHPRPLLVAAEQIGVAPQRCLYLGDALRDVQAALAAGMVPLGARFGYLSAADEPQRWPVAGWLNDPLDLLPWVGLDRSGQRFESVLNAG